MTSSPRLALSNGSHGGDGTEQPPVTWPVVVMRWLDKDNARMPFVFSLHYPYPHLLQRRGGVVLADDTTSKKSDLPTFNPIDFVENKSRFPVLDGRELHGRSITSDEAMQIKLGYLGQDSRLNAFRRHSAGMFSVIDFQPTDTVFDLFRKATPEQQYGILVTKAGNDDNRRLALRIEAELQHQGVINDASADRTVVELRFKQPKVK